MANTETDNIYTCTFCEKKEQGKPLTFLKHQSDRDKVKLDGTNVSLMPVGWDWDIRPVKFTDIFSCGCHKLR
jgi:hypothetical protein